MEPQELYAKYDESLKAAIAAGIKCSDTGARYIDWLTSSDEPATEEELAVNEDRIEWLKACEKFEAAKQASYKARAEYKLCSN